MEGEYGEGSVCLRFVFKSGDMFFLSLISIML